MQQRMYKKVLRTICPDAKGDRKNHQYLLQTPAQYRTE